MAQNAVLAGITASSGSLGRWRKFLPRQPVHAVAAAQRWIADQWTRARFLPSAYATMTPALEQFVRDEDGEDLIEYGLLSSFIASVALVTILMDPVGVRTSVVDAYKRAVEALYMAAQGDLEKR